MADTLLREINFFTTYKCNSRCKNCHIWEGRLHPPSRKEIRLADLQKLFSDPLFQACPGIGLAGGEPTIAPFFWKLMDCLPEDKSITITTNGLSSSRLLDYLKRDENRERYTIQLSLDGIGDVNDEIRGVRGAYQKTMNLLRQLELLEVRRLISFTINRLNFHQLKECYALAGDHGAEFSTRMAYSGGAYTNKENSDVFRFEDDELERLENDLRQIAFQELMRPGHSPAKVIFVDKIMDYYRKEQKDIPCRALETGMVIDLYGNVFPNCPAMMKPVGNLNESSLGEILESGKAQKMRKAIEDFRCGGCWNDCQVVTNISMDRVFYEKEYAALKMRAFGLASMKAPETIDFNQDDSPLLLLGWHHLEGEPGFRYRWTEQQCSFVIPKGTRSLEVFAAPPPDSSPERPYELNITNANGGVVSVLFSDPSWLEYRIELHEPFASAGICRWTLNRSFCPKDKGAGDDERHLGLAVNRISFCE